MRDQELTMFRGDAKAWGFTITDPDDPDLPVDITSASVTFTAKRKASDDDDDAIVQKSVGSGVTITDGPNGRCSVQLQESDTDDLTVPLTLRWDLEIEGSDGKQTVAAGTLRVMVDITRDAP